jgi:FlaA1/EpsC-like NDP-sugar epimerase
VSTEGLHDSCILVTGGTGSIGRALVKELGRLGAGEIRVFARHERTDGVERSSGSTNVQFVEADIGDPNMLARAIRGVHVVFHLAALKDVAACEADPDTALRTNVVGSANLLRAANKEPGVRRLIAVSSNNACAPSGVLGMTKALMERLVTQFAYEGTRSFGSVRFGNVWGASGSVLERWQTSAAQMGSIDVTDPKMTRFFLTEREATGHLVALASRPFTGEVVAPRMRAYRLGDLADAFAKERRVAIRVIGPRAGEKLHEDLVSKDESPAASEEGHLIVIDGRHRSSGIGPFTSADAETISDKEIRELVRPL